MLTVHKLTAGDFPSFLEGLSLRRRYPLLPVHLDSRFPFLFGRAFIEAGTSGFRGGCRGYFPSFLEGLSLRLLAC